MFKKSICLVLAVLTALTVAFAVPASADTTEYTAGDYKYTVLEDGTAKITAYTGTETEITLPETVSEYSVSYIGDEAFANNENLLKVIIPESVKTIGEGAFYWCLNLDTVVVPNSVTQILSAAFSDCYNLRTISLPNELETVCSKTFKCCDMLSEITIPDSVTIIEEEAFAYAPLATVNIPKNVKKIEKGAFQYCRIETVTVSPENNYFAVKDNVLFNKDLTELVLYPASYSKNKTYTVPNGVKKIGDYAFCYNQNLTKVNISSSVEELGEGAFEYASGITEAVIPENVKKIGFRCFIQSENLKKITISSNISVIPEQAFLICKSLQTLVVPEGVKEIGNWAFENCYALTEITLPRSLKKIGAAVFAECSKIEKVTYGGTKAEFDVLCESGPGNQNIKNAKIIYLGECIENGHSLKIINKKQATLYKKGYTGDSYCTYCDKIIKKGKVIAKKTLSKPKVTVKGGKRYLKVKYKKVSNATGFKVNYKIGKKSVTKTVYTKKSLTKTFKKLKKGTYKVKVQSFAKSGKYKAYSDWSKTYKVKVK